MITVNNIFLIKLWLLKQMYSIHLFMYKNIILAQTGQFQKVLQLNIHKFKCDTFVISPDFVHFFHLGLKKKHQGFSRNQQMKSTWTRLSPLYNTVWFLSVMQHALAVSSLKHHQWSNALPSGFPTSAELMGESCNAPLPPLGWACVDTWGEHWGSEKKKENISLILVP